MITEIKTNYEYLIHLIASVLNGTTPIEKPEHISFVDVFQCGLKHFVANIAYYGIEKLTLKPDMDLLSQWEQERDKWVLKDINQGVARSEIVGLLQKQNIPFIEAQGTVVKKFYTQSDWRAMSDIDFIVSLTDLPKTKAVFKELWFVPKSISELEIDAIRKPDIFVEMHSDFFYTGEYSTALPNPFECCKDESNRLKDEYFYLYNFLHFCKHYFGNGCGIRNIMDLYLINKQLLPNINEEFIKEKLIELKLDEFHIQISNLANIWFDENVVYKDTYQAVEEYLFDCGVYGNLDIALKNKFQKQKKAGMHFIKLRHIWSLIFLSPEHIAKKYSIKKHIKLLYLPLSIYRIIGVIFKKLPKSLSTIKKIIKI